MASGLRAPSQAHSDGVGSRDRDSGFFSRWTAPVNDTTPVARRSDALVGESELRARTHAWRSAFAQVPNAAIALIEPDGVHFAAAMVGAFYAGKTVYLPGDSRPDTCASLAALDVAFVGAFDDEWNPIAATAPGDAVAKFESLSADDAQLVIYTSGSTGAPQALHKRLSQLLAEVDALENAFGAQLGDSVILATVSHQHIYGLLFKILLPLVSRRTFVATSVLYPEEIVSHMVARRTALVSGPAHLKRLPTNIDWSSAREHATIVFSSGGPLAIDAVNSVQSLLGIAPVEVYGSSETGGIAWRQRTNGVEQPWTPLPGVQVRANESDECLAVRSKHLADNDWYVVADRVEFVDNARFNLRGRVDRIAKIEGKRVSLVAIEDALLRSGLVADVRVVLLDTGRDELGAVVVLNEHGWDALRTQGVDALRATLNAGVAESTERIARPRRWRWLSALPANDVGKATQDALIQLFAPHSVQLPAEHVMQRTEQRAVCELYVSPHLACFDGHFESLPVLPGVAQIDWAVLFARRYFAITGEFERMEAVKFQRLYRPGPMLSLELEWFGDRHMFSFRYTSSDGPHSSGRIYFTR